jgi:hypothetical protein
MNYYEKIFLLFVVLDTLLYCLSLFLIEFRIIILIIFFLMCFITGLVYNTAREERGTVHAREI